MTSWKWRALLYGTFLIACGIAIWPPFGRNGEPGKLKLGLDLRGGTHLVLQVLPESSLAGTRQRVTPETLKEVIRTLERRVNQLGVADPVITEVREQRRPGPRPAPGRGGRRAGQAADHQRGPALAAPRGRGGADPREASRARFRKACRPRSWCWRVKAMRPETSAFYLVRREAVVTGRDLKSARAGRGELGQPNVRFTLKPQGAEALERETAPQYRPPAGHRLRRSGDLGPDDRQRGGNGRTDPRGLHRRGGRRDGGAPARGCAPRQDALHPGAHRWRVARPRLHPSRAGRLRPPPPSWSPPSCSPTTVLPE